jgi:helicase
VRQTLRSWIADADTRQNVELFRLQSHIPGLSYQDGREFDLYLSLVGEMFDLLRDPPDDPRDWATLANAFTQAGGQFDGAARRDAFLMAAAAFYTGGFSASAYVAMRQVRSDGWPTDTHRACYDFLARPYRLTSERVTSLVAALARGDLDSIAQTRTSSAETATQALHIGPEEWVAERIYSSLVDRFSRTNLRAVLPDGGSQRWNPLVESLLGRTRPVWDFFPSQITAIEAGLLTGTESFSMQMPTGAGKTALTETLLFNHLTDRPGELAALLVPYRALARELRGSIGSRLTKLGLPTRTVYGGTVPTYDEAQGLDELRVIIATPEAFTGLLGSAPELLSRISLVVCDEGHLLDQPGRGVGLELLLARFRGRTDNPPRTVFVSAIVPNIEEINAWLGGSEQSVARSNFRPAEAEYAVLRPSGRGASARAGLEMQSIDSSLEAHTLPDFLSPADFRFDNPATHRTNNFPHESYKTQAIAAARKALVLGTVAVFSTMKRGDQGVIGLAEELLRQLDRGIPLPKPIDHVMETAGIDVVADYLGREFGADWVGTRCLEVGAVVHHGDLPQETREAVEELLAAAQVRMVLCTSTLAEGVNMPIRTLVLYTIRRQSRTGAESMLARDIRNLVGRAGRAGSSTKGLVILANDSQWEDLQPVVTGEPGESVHGFLRRIVEALQRTVDDGTRLTNAFLEGNAVLHSMTDGIDATLLELLSDELGDAEFREIAAGLAFHTFASQQLDRRAQTLLADVFTLRAQRLIGLRETDRLGWVRETGARPRLVDSIIAELVPLLDHWDIVESPLAPDLIDAFLDWAYRQGDFRRELQEGFPTNEQVPPLNVPAPADVRDLIIRWLAGDSFAQMAAVTGREVDVVLRIYGSVISYSFATLVEQAVAVMQSYFRDADAPIAEAVANLPEYLRHGVSTEPARMLMAGGLRHRRAAVLLGGHAAMNAEENFMLEPRDIARNVITGEEGWREALGDFVFNRTLADLGAGPEATEDTPGAAGPAGQGSGPYPDGGPGADSGSSAVSGGGGSGEEGTAGSAAPAPDDSAAGIAPDGWESDPRDLVESEAIGYVRALTGNSLPPADAESVLRALLELIVDEATSHDILSNVGDTVVHSVHASPPDYPLVEYGTVHETEYGLTVEEATVAFVADLRVGVAANLADVLGVATGGEIAERDDDWAVVKMVVSLHAVVQIRAEFESAEVTEAIVRLNRD